MKDNMLHTRGEYKERGEDGLARRPKKEALDDDFKCFIEFSLIPISQYQEFSLIPISVMCLGVRSFGNYQKYLFKFRIAIFLVRMEPTFWRYWA